MATGPTGTAATTITTTMMSVEIIDIHAHMLPGLDDGPGKWEESVEMARQAAAEGISTIVATPHVIIGRYDYSAAFVAERTDELQRRLADAGVKVRVVPGGEVFLDDGLLDAARSGRIPSVANAGKYLLIELPASALPASAERIVFELAVAGVTPIIAHPERNEDVIKDPNRLLRLIERGALAQVNAGSLVGDFGRRAREAARILITHGMAQVVGSDAHSADRRPFRLAAAFDEVTKLVGPDRARAMMHDVPAQIVGGLDVIVQSPEPYKRRRWFSRFL